MTLAFSAIWLASASAMAVAGQLGAASESPKLPAFSEARAIVEKHFAALPDYQPGDLISRNDVEPLFAKLEKAGWEVEDRAAILASTLPNNDFLVTLLHSSKGRTMMRHVAKEQISFELMDQMQHRKDGKQLLKDAVQSNEGRHLMNFAASTQRGKELGIEKAQPPVGRDTSKLAGRIYSAEQLLRRLEISHTIRGGRPPGLPLQ